LVFAKTNDLYALAKKNSETECVRSLAQPVLLKNKVRNHTFSIKNTMDDFSILYGLETAQLENKQTIRLKHISCESYGFDIQLILNSTDIEKNHKLCQSCFIQELCRIAIYLQQDDRAFYLDGITALEQQFTKSKTFEINIDYMLKGTEEMPQTFSFKQIQKQKKAIVAKDSCCLKRSILLATATTAK
jgi:hypothetical protein